MSRFIAALTVAFAATSITTAPMAVADPVAGGQSASATIKELEAQGYDVDINWMNGSRPDALSDCSVTAIHKPDESDGPPATFTSVYVDVLCPEEDFGVGLGVGLGFG